MYKQITTDAEVQAKNSGFGVTQNTETIHPVATLADEYGGRCQIVVDDHCYVLYLKQADGFYTTTSWIFKEVFNVLKTLSEPD